jgi:DNA processing protein
MTDLFAAADFQDRAISPVRELGAYEALWAQDGATFKTLADRFRARPGCVPSDFVSSSDAERYARLALGAIREAGIGHFGVRVHGAGEYPAKLRDAAHPVELLYFQGNWNLVERPGVAIVGTREPSSEGVRRAQKLARLLSAEGFVIVSGLARGIDTAAHSATLDSGGATIAVIGTPITTAYPAENGPLQRRIADECLVVSQVPIVRYSRQRVPMNRLFFPERNVTMSALTSATIIVEAGETSGTLIQARHALQQGRRLFILESCFHRPDLTWPARFVERGAIRVAEFEDILSHLSNARDAARAAAAPDDD